jgi:hypothetical protein
MSKGISVHPQSNSRLFRKFGTCFKGNKTLNMYMIIMLLSQEVIAIAGSPKTLRFVGQIQGNVVVILVDSGSSHSFINDSIAQSLKNVTQVPNAIKVQVANCHLICCTSKIKQDAWTIQEKEFISDVKVIP